MKSGYDGGKSSEAADRAGLGQHVFHSHYFILLTKPLKNLKNQNTIYKSLIQYSIKRFRKPRFHPQVHKIHLHE